ncbi:MAG: hypothetical protein AAGU15_08985 [Anaerolineaceae bacterium]
MTVRTTMTELISLVRGLINDPLESDMTFQEYEIQVELDLYRTWNNIAALTALPSADGSQTNWKATQHYWESPVLTDGVGNTLTPETTDAIAGYFVFAETQEAVFASGFSYDVYAAAAELLTMWAGRLAQDITKFSADGSSFEFGGLQKAKLDMAARYRAMSPSFSGIKLIKLARDD